MPQATRRAVLGAAAGTLLARPGLAQERFPAKPVRVFVPFAPGGTTDVQMRALCDAASRRFGQPVVVENRSGAGGILGAQALIGTRPDGYTLAQMPVSVFRYPQMVAKPPFDPTRDFSWVLQLTGYLFGVVVRADAPWHSFSELLDYAKANPGKVNYGSPGTGTSLHITMEQIALSRGIEWTHVPFRGVAEDLQALLAGQITVSADASGWAELVKDGRLRLLCTWGAERARRFPDAPTLREQGIDVVSESPYGLAGPAGMDPAVIRVLQDGFRDAMNDPVHLAVLERLDMSVAYLNSEDYARAAQQQFRDDGEMIRRLGLKAG
ncbi:Bug family tripartite tricarboxylate transporter substrate binding protein [Roseomonas haemaphysalidis]|jgi:tripartite-type tricarboxylate transporter receptor subunit TctC|uniref:Tripartite tricarboxylate transporter substrate binding protein n=1 Tax=Roseomonas haemaphysalidis TaxID=2768162 RepID=A0ABS3KK91_9PROT|nr:tripartite tricarboxylate transporter substrate binding protein [Roseomonas haemaphysalidis]MBO1077894.1 tripartite tricarboxylate transporter substrate binding protein [Roseomonas haemaphysalidis]